MTKHIILQKDYTKNPNGFQLKLPLNLECIIPENDSVRLLSQFVEEMDLTDLYSTYERIPENTLPRRMLKIVLYSYMNGDFSSRSMQRNCQRDINFMYLLEGSTAPDHATFARFRTLHFAPCAAAIMAEMTNFLHEIVPINILLSGRRRSVKILESSWINLLVLLQSAKKATDSASYTIIR